MRSRDRKGAVNGTGRTNSTNLQLKTLALFFSPSITIVRRGADQVDVSPPNHRSPVLTPVYPETTSFSELIRYRAFRPIMAALLDRGLSVLNTTQELIDFISNLFDVCFESEMTGVQELHSDVRVIATVRFRSCGKKKRVVLAPDRESWRL